MLQYSNDDDAIVTIIIITTPLPTGVSPTNIPTQTPSHSPTISMEPTKSRPREYQSLKPFELNLIIPNANANANNNETLSSGESSSEPAVIDISEVDRLTTKYLTGFFDLQLNQGVSDYSTFGYVSLSINYFRVKSEKVDDSSDSADDGSIKNDAVRRRYHSHHRRLANQIAEASFTGSSVFYGTDLPDKKIMHQLEADAFEGESLGDFLALLQTSYDEVLASVTNVTVVMESNADPVVATPIDDGGADTSSGDNGMTIVYIGIAASVVVGIVALTVMYVWRNRSPPKFSAAASRGSRSASTSLQSRREQQQQQQSQVNTDDTSPQPLMAQGNNQVSGRYYGNYQEETESVIQETHSVISGKSYDYSMDGFSLANRSGVPKAGDDKSVYSEMLGMDDMSLMTGIIERKDSGNMETLLVENGSRGSFMDDAATLNTFVNQQDDESTWSFSKVAGSKSMSPSQTNAERKVPLPNENSIVTRENDERVFNMTRPVAQMSMSSSLEERPPRNALSYPPHMSETQGSNSYETSMYSASMNTYPTNGAQSFPPHLGQDTTLDPSGTFDPSRAESYLEPNFIAAKSEDDAISLSTIDLVCLFACLLIEDFLWHLLYISCSHFVLHFHNLLLRTGTLYSAKENKHVWSLIEREGKGTANVCCIYMRSDGKEEQTGL